MPPLLLSLFCGVLHRQMYKAVRYRYTFWRFLRVDGLQTIFRIKWTLQNRGES